MTRAAPRVAIAICWTVAATIAPSQPRTKGKLPVKLTLQLNKTRFAQGESVDLALRLTNTGPGSMQAPILDNNDNDQPVYILTRPGQAKPETFTKIGRASCRERV